MPVGVKTVSAVLLFGILSAGLLRPARSEYRPQPVPKAVCGPDDRTESVQGQTTLAERFAPGKSRAYHCNLELIGQFEGEGAGPGMDAFESCAYFSIMRNPQTRHPGIAVLDVSDSRTPRPTAYLDSPAAAGLMGAFESVAVSHARKLLIASLMSPKDPTPFDLYDLSTDCRHPTLIGSIAFPGLYSHWGQFSSDGRVYYGAKWPLNQRFRIRSCSERSVYRKQEKQTMSTDQDRNETLGPQGRGRRQFLTHTAFAAAVSSAAVVSPATAAEQAGARRAREECAPVNTPMKDVKEKVAFITGGSSGIGLGITQAFVGAGMKVVMAARNEDGNKEALAQFAAANQSSQVHAIRVDVTDRAGMEKAAAETIEVFGKIHVLVNNAGISHPVSLQATTYDDWDWMIGVNLTGVFNGIRTFLPHIKAHGDGGQIISTSSVLGLFAAGTMGAYSASKFAVVGLMESLRAELANTNVGVSVYCPGSVIPNMMRSSLNRPDNLPESTFKPDAQMLAREQEARKAPQVQAAVLAAGKFVLRGMRNNDLYILTHSEDEQILHDRSDALLAAIPQDVRPAKEHIEPAPTKSQDSIYAVERDRRRCSRNQGERQSERISSDAISNV
jgi:NAD(P)-dependent dehydrogenase (short-subunit alcohol dehydrogenase family)